MALGSHSGSGCKPRAGGTHLLGEACGARGHSGGSLACHPQYFILQQLWHDGMGSGGHGHLADDRHAGDGRGDGVGVRPASDVTRYSLDL